MHPKNYTHKDLKYLDWVRGHPCLVCRLPPRSEAHHNEHAKKNDYLAVPLCRAHHHQYHTIPHKEFEDRYSINFLFEIINYLSQYIKEHGNSILISK